MLGLDALLEHSMQPDIHAHLRWLGLLSMTQEVNRNIKTLIETCFSKHVSISTCDDCIHEASIAMLMLRLLPLAAHVLCAGG